MFVFSIFSLCNNKLIESSKIQMMDYLPSLPLAIRWHYYTLNDYFLADLLAIGLQIEIKDDN